MARIGVLTGGGDCPGLNAVIRAVVRRGLSAGRHSFVGFRYGWAGVLADDAVELDDAEHGGHPAPRRHDPRHLAHEPLRRRAATAPRRSARTLERARRRRADPDRRRGHAGRGPAPAPRGRAGRGGAQDDRQRPRRHRRHVRLPDRRADRHRRDRPPAHDGRVAQPRDGGRGDGPPRRLDRHPRRASPAAPTRSSCPSARSTSRRSCAHLRRRHERGRSFSIVVVAEGATPREGTLQVHGGNRDRRLRPRPTRRHRRHAGGRDRAAHRLRDARDDPRPRAARRHAGRV